MAFESPVVNRHSLPYQEFQTDLKAFETSHWLFLFLLESRTRKFAWRNVKSYARGLMHA